MAKNTLKSIKNLVKEHKNGNAKVDTSAYEEEFLESINDDLNMPKAIAVAQKMLKEDRSQDVYKAFEKFNQVLGLSLEGETISDEIKGLAEKRWQAKLARDWATADTLRAQLDSLGYTIKDSKESYEIIKK